MDNFLNSYMTYFQPRSESTKIIFKRILSDVKMLLRHHNSDNRLCSNCCNDNENDLRVTNIDRYGFVTEVTCTKCHNYMDTVCYTKWTKERICNKSQLKVGDHICWHRWYVIWHHAIVNSINPLKVIHYHEELKVVEDDFSKVTTCSKRCTGCDALYRINYEDCYNSDYTALRARRLLGESRYNMVERNCEHFSSWCKTGLSNSGQVSILSQSLRKAVITICLRLAALAILALIQYSHEEFEEEVKDRKWYEKVEKVLTCFYIVGVTILFVIHLLITSGSRLAAHPNRRRCHDSKNPWSCAKQYVTCTNNRRCLWRCICCSLCSCFNLSCQGFVCLFTWCKYIKCSPFTCCRRPGNLACGLCFRILLREIPGLIGTLCIIVNEDTLFKGFSPVKGTLVIMLCIMVVQLVGYVFGVFLGRLVEALFECKWCYRGLPPCTQGRRYGSLDDRHTSQV